MTYRSRGHAALLLLGLLGARLSSAAGILYNRTYVSPKDGAVRIYDVRTPAGYDGVAKRPAVLFLHGRGGSKGSFQLASYQAEADARGYVLIFWQGRVDFSVGAYSTYYIDGVNGFPDETDVLACLDDALKSFAIDPDRVHLTGFSQGGKGALLVGLKNPDRFASLVEGAGPSDAFEGQIWSPTFPDFRSAAGGGPDFGGDVLARWYAQSARFLLGNARNLPMALFHGGLDVVVPDSTSLFPYRNTHHIADLPGFSDARGRWPTLSELRTADPGGYAFETHYPPNVDHDEERLLVPKTLFDYFGGKTRSLRPGQVVATGYEDQERRYYWTRLGRTAPADGTPDGLSAVADSGSNRFSLSLTGRPAVTLDVPGAGLDASRHLEIRIDAGSRLSLRLDGPFPVGLRVVRSGTPLAAGSDYLRVGASVVFPPFDLAASTLLSVEPAPPADVLETDLLVPALVEADGQMGARFETELDLANTGGTTLTVDALLLDGRGRHTALELPPGTTRGLSSASLFALLGTDGGAAPLRLRVTDGPAASLVASARVFNTVASGGTYGLSFPVAAAGASVLAPGDLADLFGGTADRPARMNVSLFAPFEAAAATVEAVDAIGRPLATTPVSLAPLERRQLNDVLANVPAPGKVRISVASGRIQAYGTVVSNSVTNDPFRSPALKRTDTSTSWTVPAVAAAPGRNGAVFSSDLYLAEGSMTRDFVIDIDVTYRPRDGGTPRTTSVRLLPGTIRVLSDVVAALFPDAVPGAGALELRTPFAIEVFAVTRSDPETGPSSQDFPCVAEGHEITAGAPAAFAGLAEFEGARSNLVLVNRGPATAVTLTLLTDSGPRGSVAVPLAAGEVKQIDSVALVFPGGGGTRAATLVVAPAAEGSVVASVARIDNLTNDPAGLAPVTLPR